jgi:uncharacterized protein (DUF608 family)
MACAFLCGVVRSQHTGRPFNSAYSGENNSRVAFPIGGMGAGMFCLEGTGAIGEMSVRNSPDIFNEPAVFAAITIKDIPNSTRVLEGPVPGWKRFGQWGDARGAEGTTFGLARFTGSEFIARFPFGKVTLKDDQLPLSVSITGWSPFIPTDADNSSMPVGGLEYIFKNTSQKIATYIFSYNATNFMSLQDHRGNPDPEIGNDHIGALANGFILQQDGTLKSPEQQGDFAIWTREKSTVDHCWFRGGWYDPLSMAWNKLEKMDTSFVSPVTKAAPGASLYVSFTLKPGEEKTIHLMMAWYVPDSHLRIGTPVTKSSDTAFRDES